MSPVTYSSIPGLVLAQNRPKNNSDSSQFSLPVNPDDGQIVEYIADASNGIIWLMRYNASSPYTYKWEMLGGADLFSEVNALESVLIVGSLDWDDMPTPGPTLVIPHQGDYLIEIGCDEASKTSIGVTSRFYMGYSIGAIPPNTADATTCITRQGGDNDAYACRRQTVKTLPATTLHCLYSLDAGGNTIRCRNRTIMARPIRLG